MSSIEGAETRVGPPTGRLIDARFARRLALVNALIPAALLVWDAIRHQLGVNDINFSIRTTGILGLVMLVLALLVTPIRRLTGWNTLIAIRRTLGLIGFVYIVIHFTLFWLLDRQGSFASTLEEIGARVYLWFGVGALVGMIPLAVTSTDAMVRRLGATRWKRLHRLTYPIAIGGVVHYYLLVKSDVRQPLGFAIVVGALLAYRAVQHYVDLRVEIRNARARAERARPIAAAQPRRFWSGELRVARVFDETHDVRTFRLVAPAGGPLPFDHVAGQYLNLALTIDGARVNRSYTIASSPTHRTYCEISVKRAREGRASRHLHDAVCEGSLLRVSAPAGRFVFAAEQADRCVLIAGGIGITPLMSTVRGLTDTCWRGEIYLLFSIRTLRDLVFRDELAYLERRFPNLHVRATLTGEVDGAWDGERGHISRAMIERFVPGLARGPILVCGPDAMMTAVRRVLVDELGVPDAEVLQEAFISPMDAVEAGGAEAETTSEVDPTTSGGSAANAMPASVRFERTGKVAELATGLTVLEAAEDAGVSIPFECRSGICGQCKTRLVSGRVEMTVQDALTPADRSRRLILACQARAVGEIIVDA